MDAAAMGPGVLHPESAATRFALTRHEPAADLAPFVDFYWVVRWDLTGQSPYEQAILPHPNVNLAFESGQPPAAGVYGVDTKVFVRRLSGAGKALGIRFRPGGFRPFHSAPISSLNDRVVPATAIFGPAAATTLDGVLAADDDEAMIACAARFLLAADPIPDPVTDEVATIVARITADPSLRRVGELVSASGTPERRLQRMFAEYVGVSPKWVMRRARLHEAALRADEGEGVDWAALAADLGYADQAHLTRDFTATLGVPPTRYAARR
jgi:AraC-like DNA-binding protein